MCREMARRDADSTVAAVLRSPGKPNESATSHFELRLTGGAGDVAVVVAPNDLVTHSQLFGLIAGTCFSYFGPRITSYGVYQAREAAKQWNMALANLGGSRLVPDERTARAAAVLLLAFATGEPILLESTEDMYELVYRDSRASPNLPRSTKLRMSFIVHRNGDWWDVAGKSKEWTFRLHIAENGMLRDLEVRATD